MVLGRNPAIEAARKAKDASVKAMKRVDKETETRTNKRKAREKIVTPTR
jgi:hypothetical protein